MLTNFYIDAFSFYYGCLKGSPHKWLHLVEFCRQSFPPPTNQLNRVRYFTARIIALPDDPQQPVRQNAYLRALKTLPELSIHEGHYERIRKPMRLVDPLPDGTETVTVWKTEEKGSDVNLASYLLLDAFRNEFEAAIVVTNDSDLVEPIRIVRKEFAKRVVVLFLVGEKRFGNNDLKKVASIDYAVDPAVLAACHLPEKVTDAKGTVRKPKSW